MFLGRHPDPGDERKFPRQIAMLALSPFSVVVVILALPIPESFRNRLIGLTGFLVSGVIAFSSASIFANLMGDLPLRITRPFRTGDFVRIGEHFGRVSERGLFDTEIQELEASLEEAVDGQEIRIKKNIESARERLKALEDPEEETTP